MELADSIGRGRQRRILEGVRCVRIDELHRMLEQPHPSGLMRKQLFKAAEHWLEKGDFLG